MDEQVHLNEKNDTARSDAWLFEYARKNTSQFGEDGIIEKILEVIGMNDKWCVEFGSWDGKRYSNTFSLISEKGFSAVLIEASKRKFRNLVKNFKDNDKVTCINKYVGFEQRDNLDTILAETEIPNDFDVLSIDIDGNDYHTWNAIKDYKPKVVIVEFNPTIPPEVEFVQPADFKVTQGSSLLSIDKLAKSKGYELVCATKINALFVNEKYYQLFGIKDNSVSAMMTDKSLVTHIFCGYDGTVFIRGYGKQPWYGIVYKESKLQILPRWAIKRVGDKNFIRRKFGKIYRRLVKE